MSGKRYILSIDQGTTGSAALIFNNEGKPLADSDTELTQIFPQPGWVEHDPEEIFQTSLKVAREAVVKSGINYSDISGIGYYQPAGNHNNMG